MLLQQGWLWMSCYQLLHRLVHPARLLISHGCRRYPMLQQASLCLQLSLPVLLPLRRRNVRKAATHAGSDPAWTHKQGTCVCHAGLAASHLRPATEAELTPILLVQVTDLYDPREQWASYLINAVKAKELQLRDVNYIVRGEEVIIVDEFTGRTMPGRR